MNANLANILQTQNLQGLQKSLGSSELVNISGVGSQNNLLSETQGEFSALLKDSISSNVSNEDVQDLLGALKKGGEQFLDFVKDKVNNNTSFEQNIPKNFFDYMRSFKENPQEEVLVEKIMSLSPQEKSIVTKLIDDFSNGKVKIANSSIDTNFYEEIKIGQTEDRRPFFVSNKSQKVNPVNLEKNLLNQSKKNYVPTLEGNYLGSNKQFIVKDKMFPTDLKEVRPVQNQNFFKANQIEKVPMQAYGKQNIKEMNGFIKAKENTQKPKSHEIKAANLLNRGGKLETLEMESILPAMDQVNALEGENVFASDFSEQFSKSDSLTTSSDSKVIDLKGVTNKTELIDKVAQYIEQNNAANLKSIDVKAWHQDLGHFKINASKNAGSDTINLEIISEKESAKAFFNENESNLLKSLSKNGVKVADLKVVMAESGKMSNNLDNRQSQEFSKDSSGQGQAERSFTNGNDNMTDHNNGKSKREALWDMYRKQYQNVA